MPRARRDGEGRVQHACFVFAAALDPRNSDIASGMDLGKSTINRIRTPSFEHYSGVTKMGVRATPLSEALTLEGGKLRDCDLLQTRTLRYPAIAIAPNPSPLHAAAAARVSC